MNQDRKDEEEAALAEAVLKAHIERVVSGALRQVEENRMAGLNNPIKKEWVEGFEQGKGYERMLLIRGVAYSRYEKKMLCSCKGS